MMLHAKETPDKLQPFGPLAHMRLYLFYIQLFQFMLTTLKVKVFAWSPLATNSFGLGRLCYKSSRHLQNFRRHGN